MTSPRDTALLISDMQNDFCARGGCVEAAIGRDATPCRAIVPAVEALAKVARGARVPVIRVRARYGLEHIQPAMRRKQLQNAVAVCCADGCWGIDYFELQPAPGDVKIFETSFSAFNGSDLADRLERQGISRLAFAGVQTNVCVENSLRDALCMGFDCALPDDCVSSHALHLHEASQAKGMLYADRTTLKDLVSDWSVAVD